MAKRVGVDKWLFCTVVVLVLFGLVMVFSASAVQAKAETGSPYHYVFRQAGWALAGIVFLLAAMQIDYRRYNNPKVVFPVVAVTAMLLLAVFAVPAVKGAHRWFHFAGFSLEPSELAKPAIVLFMAYFLQTRLHEMDDWRGTVLRAAAPSLILTALILKQPDLGTAGVCAVLTVLMLFLAGMQMRYIGFGALAASPVLYYMLFMVPWRHARIMAYLHPEADSGNTGYQIMQAKIAVGTGGIFGHGLMEGIQKLFYLPESPTDFIYANICEELGLLGALFVVGLFCVLAYRGLRAALMATDPFARFLAFGITAAILIQAFFNISVVLALLPNKGITLPFISFGGTSLFVTLIGMGVLLNITRAID